MDDSWSYVDPAEATAKVVGLIMGRYGIPEDVAIVRFMKSRTFRLLTEDQSMAQLPAEDILRIYEKEEEK